MTKASDKEISEHIMSAYQKNDLDAFDKTISKENVYRYSIVGTNLLFAMPEGRDKKRFFTFLSDSGLGTMRESDLKY